MANADRNISTEIGFDTVRGVNALSALEMALRQYNATVDQVNTAQAQLNNRGRANVLTFRSQLDQMRTLVTTLEHVEGAWTIANQKIERNTTLVNANVQATMRAQRAIEQRQAWLRNLTMTAGGTIDPTVLEQMPSELVEAQIKQLEGLLAARQAAAEQAARDAEAQRLQAEQNLRYLTQLRAAHDRSTREQLADIRLIQTAGSSANAQRLRELETLGLKLRELYHLSPGEMAASGNLAIVDQVEQLLYQIRSGQVPLDQLSSRFETIRNLLSQIDVSHVSTAIREVAEGYRGIATEAEDAATANQRWLNQIRTQSKRYTNEQLADIRLIQTAGSSSNAQRLRELEVIGMRLRELYHLSPGETSQANNLTIVNQIDQLLRQIKTGQVPLDQLSSRFETIRNLLGQIDTTHVSTAIREVAEGYRSIATEAEESARANQRWNDRIRYEYNRTAQEQRANILQMQAAGSSARAKEFDEIRRIIQLYKERAVYVTGDPALQRNLGTISNIENTIARIRSGQVPVAQLSAEFANLQTQLRQIDTRHTSVALGELATGLRDVGKTSKEAANQVLLSWQSVIRLFAIQLAHQGVSLLTLQLRESAQAAIDFGRRVSEIQTLSQKAAVSAGEWRDRLRSMSDEFGNPILDVAASTYETISNQIAEGVEAFDFMQSAIELALSTTGTVADATDAVSGVLNAFQMELTRSDEIAAKLFKTVDLGRFTLNELSGDIGRVSILSRELGITFDEQQAALSLLTINGLQSNVALTFLANVEQKLIRPTDRMKELFREWGVTSGEAAVKAFGFIGVLQRMEQAAMESGDELSEIGEIFGRLRAITGATGLIANMEQFQQFREEIKAAGEEYQNAVDIVLNSKARELEIQLNKVQNMFTLGFGEAAMDGLLALSGAFGGLDNVVYTSIITVEGLTVAWGAYKVAALIAAAANKGLAASFAGLMTGYGALWGIGAAVVALSVQSYVLADSLNEVGEKARRSSEELRREKFEGIGEALNKRSDEFINELEEQFRAMARFMAGIRAHNNFVTDGLKEDFEEVSEAVKAVTEDALGVLRDRIGEIRQESRAAAEDAKQALREARDIVRELDDFEFRGDLGAIDRDINKLKEQRPDGRVDNFNTFIREQFGGFATRNDLNRVQQMAMFAVFQQQRRQQMEEERLRQQQLRERQGEAVTQLNARAGELFGEGRRLFARGDVEEARSLFEEAKKLQEEAAKRLDQIQEISEDDQLRENIGEQLERLRDNIKNRQVTIGGEQFDATGKQRAQQFREMRQLEINATRMFDLEQRIAILKAQGRNTTALENQLLTIRTQIQDQVTEATRNDVNVAQERLNIEERINEQMRLREQLEEEEAARQQQLADEKIREANARQKIIEDFSKVLGRLDSFDPMGENAEAEFRDLEDSVRIHVQVLELDAAEQVRIYRELEKQKTLIRKAAEQQRTAESLKNIDRERKATEERLKAAERERLKIEQDFMGEKGQVAVSIDAYREVIAQSEAAIDAREKMFRDQVATGVPLSAQDLEQMGLLRQARDIAKQLAEANDIVQQAIVDKDANLLNDALAERRRLVTELSKIGNQIGFRRQVTQEAGFGRDARTLGQDVAKLLADEIHNIGELQKRYRDVNIQYQAQLELLEAIKQELQRIPPEYRENADASENAAAREQRSHEETIRTIREHIDTLRQLREQQEQQAPLPPPIPGGGAFASRGMMVPSYFAMGGIMRGTDRYPAMLSAGESVIDAQTTKTFAPFIRAMIDSPRYMSRGGEIRNLYFGDINVSGGKTDDITARRLIAAIRREERRGTI